MATRTKVLFKGSLNEPIITYPFLEYFALDYACAKDENERDEFNSNYAAWKKRIDEERLEKLELLLKHYRIEKVDPDHWRRLSFRMALDFVPGMRVEYGIRGKRGRPQKWKGEFGKIFYREIQAIIAERKRGVRDAIRILLKRLSTSGHELTPNPENSRRKRDDLKILSDDISISALSVASVPTLEARYHELARAELKTPGKRNRTSLKRTKKSR